MWTSPLRVYRIGGTPATLVPSDATNGDQDERVRGRHRSESSARTTTGFIVGATRARLAAANLVPPRLTTPRHSSSNLIQLSPSQRSYSSAVHRRPSVSKRKTSVLLRTQTM